MIKRLILGDIHGHNTWKDIIDKENPQEIIILGDYFDSFGIKSEDQIKNFKNILEFRKVFNKDNNFYMVRLESGQILRTVNPPPTASKVQILLSPPLLKYSMAR